MENQNSNCQTSKVFHSPIGRGMIACGKSFKTVVIERPKIISNDMTLDHSSITYSAIFPSEKPLDFAPSSRIQESRVLKSSNNKIEIVKDTKIDLPIISIKRNLAYSFDNENEKIIPIKEKMCSLKLDDPDIKEKVNEADKKKETKAESRKRKANKIEIGEQQKTEVTNVEKITEKMDHVQKKKRKLDEIEVAKEKMSKVEVVRVKEIQAEVVKKKSNEVNKVVSGVGKIKKTRSTQAVKFQRDPYNLRPRTKKES